MRLGAKRMAEVVRFQERWALEHPELPPVIVNLDWRNPELEEEPPAESGPYVSMARFMKIFGVSFTTALEILHRERITLWVVAKPRTMSWRISEDALGYLVRRNTRSMIRFARRGRNGVLLWFKCQRCAVNSKHYRAGFTRDGRQKVECQKCRRTYIYNTPRRPPLDSICPHCGGKGRQWRGGVRPYGKMQVECGQCGKGYLIPDPDGPEWRMHRRSLIQNPCSVERVCPRCGGKDRQWRHQLRAGRQSYVCGHCGKTYTPFGGKLKIANCKLQIANWVQRAGDWVRE